MPEVDEKIQQWYAEGRAKGYVQKNPKISAWIQEGVKKGYLNDLSGGSVPQQAATPPAPVPAQSPLPTLPTVPTVGDAMRAIASPMASPVNVPGQIPGMPGNTNVPTPSPSPSSLPPATPAATGGNPILDALKNTGQWFIDSAQGKGKDSAKHKSISGYLNNNYRSAVQVGTSLAAFPVVLAQQGGKALEGLFHEGEAGYHAAAGAIDENLGHVEAARRQQQAYEVSQNAAQGVSDQLLGQGKAMLGGEDGIIGRSARILADIISSTDKSLTPQVRQEAMKNAGGLAQTIVPGVIDATYESPAEQALNVLMLGEGGAMAAEGRAARLAKAAMSVEEAAVAAVKEAGAAKSAAKVALGAGDAARAAELEAQANAALEKAGSLNDRVSQLRTTAQNSANFAAKYRKVAHNVMGLGLPALGEAAAGRIEAKFAGNPLWEKLKQDWSVATTPTQIKWGNQFEDMRTNAFKGEQKPADQAAALAQEIRDAAKNEQAFQDKRKRNTVQPPDGYNGQGGPGGAPTNPTAPTPENAARLIEGLKPGGTPGLGMPVSAPEVKPGENMPNVPPAMTNAPANMQSPVQNTPEPPAQVSPAPAATILPNKPSPQTAQLDQRGSDVKAAMSGLTSGVSESIYDGLWDKMQKGETSEAGKPSPYLQAARMVRDRGGLQTRDEAVALIKDVSAIRDRREIGELDKSGYNAAMNGVVNKYLPARDTPTKSPYEIDDNAGGNGVEPNDIGRTKPVDTAIPAKTVLSPTTGTSKAGTVLNTDGTPALGAESPIAPIQHGTDTGNGTPSTVDSDIHPSARAGYRLARYPLSEAMKFPVTEKVARVYDQNTRLYNYKVQLPDGTSEDLPSASIKGSSGWNKSELATKIAAYHDEGTKLRQSRGEDIAEPVANPQTSAPYPQSSPANIQTSAPNNVPESIAAHKNLANTITQHLDLAAKTGVKMTPQTWQHMATTAFGSPLTSGKWQIKDAYDAAEVGMNQYVTKHLPDLMERKPSDAINALRGVLAAMPSQTWRTNGQLKLQQFSTPPTEAYVAASTLGNIRGKSVLEPSAGTGSLATMARIAGANVRTNEHFVPDANVRADLLKAQGFPVTRRDAERIDAFKEPNEEYDAVLMNPPFSSKVGVDKNQTAFGARHVESALRLLKQGGRLVAIVGGGLEKSQFRGMSESNPTWKPWFDRLAKEGFTLRADLLIDGKEYQKYGTNYDNRILVFDRAPFDGVTRPELYSGGEAISLDEAARRLQGIREERNNDNKHQGAGQRGVSSTLDGRRESGVSESREIGGATRPTEIRQDSQTAGESSAPTRVPEGATSQPSAIVPGSERASEHSGELPVREPGRGRGASGAEGKSDNTAGEGTQPVRTVEGRGDGGARTGGAVQRVGETVRGNNGGGSEPGPTRENETARSSGLSPVDDSGTDDRPVRVASKPVDVSVEKRKDNSDEDLKLFSGYAPEVQFGNGHPAPLVETGSMAGVQSPLSRLSPEQIRELIHFPQEVITEGRLSDAQLEPILYAERQHRRKLPSGETAGTLIGDGTGVGKGREAAGIAVNNWYAGNRRILWLTKDHKALASAAIRDLGSVGGWEVPPDKEGNGGKPVVPVQTMDDWQQDKAITFPEGVIVAGYDTFKNPKRVAQLSAWLRGSKEGTAPVILMDEAHKGANAVPKASAGGRAGNASNRGKAMIDIQRALPDARVTYLTATAADSVSNIGYMNRLGLWGQGTPFPSFTDFSAFIGNGGLAAMEMMAREMKQMGVYNSRSISFDGVEYAETTVPLSPEMEKIYDDAAEKWSKLIGIIDSFVEGEQLGKTEAQQFLTAFWGAHQRFFRGLLTSFKAPTIIKRIEDALADGYAPVISLDATNEGAMKEKLQEAEAVGMSIEDLDFSPKETLEKLVYKTFPVQLTTEQTDQATGKTEMVFAWKMQDGSVEYSRYKPGSEATPVSDPQKVAMRDRVMEDIGQLNVPGNLLDEIILHFGSENVAELTGRQRQLVRNKQTGALEISPRRKPRGSAGKDVNDFEAKEFNAGRRKIAIISRAAAQGIDLHAGTKFGNQKRRLHILAELGWQTKDEMQKLGRTHRSDEVSQPIYDLVSTDVGGERRFSSALAANLSQLGAMQRGDRGSAGAGELGKYDFNSDYGYRAAHTVLRGLSLAPEDLARMHLDGGRNTDIDDTEVIQKLFNRLLVLPIQKQNAYYKQFMDAFYTNINNAKMAGLHEEGVQDIRASDVKIMKDAVVHSDAASGAETRYYELQGTVPNRRRTWREALADTAGKESALYKVKEVEGKPSKVREGKEIALVHFFDTETTTGRAHYGTMYYPNGERKTLQADKVRERMEPVKAEPSELSNLWQESYNTVPKTRTEKYHVIAGLTFPIFNRIHGDKSIVRVPLGDGSRIVGLLVRGDGLNKTLRDLGVVGGDVANPADVWQLAQDIDSRERIELAGGLSLKQGFAFGGQATEIFLTNGGPIRDELLRQKLAAMGALSMGTYDKRYFVPTDEERGPEVMQKLLAEHKVVSLPPSIKAKQKAAEKSAKDNAVTVTALERRIVGYKSVIGDKPVTPEKLRDAASLSPAEFATTLESAKAKGLITQSGNELRFTDKQWKLEPDGLPGAGSLSAMDPFGLAALGTGAMLGIAALKKYGPGWWQAARKRFTKDMSAAIRFDEALGEYVETEEGTPAANDILDDIRKEFGWEVGGKREEAFLDLARRTRSFENLMGQSLVDTGLLSKEAFDQNKGTHLRRVYAFFENPDAWLKEMERKLKSDGMPSAMIGATLAEEKAQFARMAGRPMEEAAGGVGTGGRVGRVNKRKFGERSADEGMRDFLGAIELSSTRVLRGGQIAAREVAKVQLNKEVAQKLGVTRKRAEELSAMRTTSRQSGDLPDDTEFATPGERLFFYRPDLFQFVDGPKKVVRTKTDGTGEESVLEFPKHGLRGATNYFLPKNIFNELTRVTDVPKGLAGLLHKLLTWWKIGKTVGGFPGVWAGNVLGNLVLSQREAMLPIWKPQRYQEALRDMQMNKGRGGKYMDLAREYAEYPFENASMDIVPKGAMSESAKIYPQTPGERIRSGAQGALDKTMEAYGSIDTVFKHALFIDAFQKGKAMGMSEARAAMEAAEAVERTYPNFRTGTPIRALRPAVQWLRRGWVPFVSWDASVLPLLIRAFAEQPGRMAIFPAVYRSYLSMLAALRKKDEDDDPSGAIAKRYAREDASLPDYMKQGYMRLAGRDPDYATMSGTSPFGGSFFSDNPFDVIFTRVNPLLTTGYELYTNRAFATDQAIWNEKGDLPEDKRAKQVQHAVRSILPGVLGYGADTAKEIVTGQSQKPITDGAGNVRGKLTGSERTRKALGAWARFNVKSLDVDKAETSKYFDAKDTVKSVKSAIRTRFKIEEARLGRPLTRKEEDAIVQQYESRIINPMIDALP